MAVSDKSLGGLMLFVAATVFTYYTAWALLLPLLDDDNSLQNYFPEREWAVLLPAVILVVGLGAVGTFVGLTITKEKRRKAQKTKLRSA